MTRHQIGDVVEAMIPVDGWTIARVLATDVVGGRILYEVHARPSDLYPIAPSGHAPIRLWVNAHQVRQPKQKTT